MKSRIACILVFFTISPLVLTQNKLQNGSFENGAFDTGESAQLNYRDNIDNWISVGYYPQGEESWHTPEWYDELYSSYQAYDDDRLVTAREYEIIEQELTGSN